MNNKGKLAIAASVIAAFASVGIMSSQAHASSSQTNAPAVTSTSPLASIPTSEAPEAASNGVDGDNVQSGGQSGDQNSPDVTGVAGDGAGDAAGAVDGDNVQSGDQTGSDIAGSADAGSNN